MTAQRRLILLLAFAALWPAMLLAEEAGGTPAPKEEVHPVAAGIYQIGPVTLDKGARQVRFPAVVNQTAGAVEYLLVGKQGKTHESVLSTAAEPVQVHTALLLLGVSLAGGKAGHAPLTEVPSAIDANYLATARLPEGVPVTLMVRWRPAGGGDPITRRGESLIDNARTHAAMSEGPWIYNGSYFANNRFEAQVEKSFVAVITDPSALLNNPRPGHEDEEIWTAAETRLPPRGTPVEFVIQLPAKQPAPDQP